MPNENTVNNSRVLLNATTHDRWLNLKKSPTRFFLAETVLARGWHLILQKSTDEQIPSAASDEKYASTG